MPISSMVYRCIILLLSLSLSLSQYDADGVMEPVTPDKLRCHLGSCQHSLMTTEVREENMEVAKAINCVAPPRLTVCVCVCV